MESDGIEYELPFLTKRRSFHSIFFHNLWSNRYLFLHLFLSFFRSNMRMCETATFVQIPSEMVICRMCFLFSSVSFYIFIVEFTASALNYGLLIPHTPRQLQCVYFILFIAVTIRQTLIRDHHRFNRPFSASLVFFFFLLKNNNRIT